MADCWAVMWGLLVPMWESWKDENLVDEKVDLMADLKAEMLALMVQL